MNQILKKVAVISGILFVLGIISMVVGMNLGGQLTYAFNLKSHKVYVPTDEEMQYVDNTVDVEVFDSIDVELGNVDVEIKQGECYQVQYHMTSFDKPVIEVKDNNLIIRNEEDKVATYGWSFGMFGLRNASLVNEEQKKLIVTIPKNVKLENVKACSEFGDINAYDLQMESLEIKADSGDLSLQKIETVNGTILAEFGKVNLEEIEAVELVVEAASGNVSFEDISADIVEVVAEYGDVVMKDLNGETCTIKAQSGECNLDTIQLVNLTVTAEFGGVNLSGIEADKIVVDADSGNITCRDMVANTSECKAEYGDISIENAIMDNMNIICESGDCDIRLTGDVAEYDVDITVDSGVLEINGEEQGDKYKSTSKKGKSIIISSEYGDVNLQIKE